jgi:DNA-binding beta-propeller fold protein YncE
VCLVHLAPPRYSFRVDDPLDVVAIIAFLTTSMVISFLVSKLRKMTEVALSRQLCTDPGVSGCVIPVGKGPEGIDISPDGTEVWTAHSRDGKVSIISVATHRVIQTLDLNTKRSNRLKFSPDGKLVLISDLEGGDLIVLDAHSRKEIKRLRLGRMAEGVLIAPDGARA